MYKVGQVVKAQVCGYENYGIFVKLDDDYAGLIHISEIDTGFVANIEYYASIGEEIYAVVLNVDEQKKHLNLSIKNMNYHNNKEFNESILGFRPLYEKLDEWTNESLK